jgi:hypothetical protein
MLTPRELATLRAALLFWKEEMCPHDASLVRPYFDTPVVESLSASEIDQLRVLLDQAFVRYANYDATTDTLATAQLLATPAEALRAWGAAQIATVLLPLD